MDREWIFLTQHATILNFELGFYILPLIFPFREGGGRMIATIIGWFISFFLIIALMVLIIYQLTCFADLEFDYINPYDSASRINGVILPEFALQGILSLLFLLSGHWLMFLVCAPVIYYNWKMYQNRQHLVDVTEIFNQLNREKKRRLIKLIYYVILLFLSLFWIIWTVLAEDE